IEGRQLTATGRTTFVECSIHGLGRSRPQRSTPVDETTNPTFNANFSFTSVTSSNSRDAELIVKVMEEDRDRDHEVAYVSIPLEKFGDGVERKTFRLDGGGAVRITADFNEGRRNRDDTETDTNDNQKLEVDMKVEARYRGKSKYYTGIISRVRLNGTV
ncbi:hypothetical protein TrLO_g1027, partial [Triparma laevis f. longispina]